MMLTGLRGRWGCGCDMAACEVREGQILRSDGEYVGEAVECYTHHLRAYALLGVHGDTEELLELEAMRRLNLLHEEDCR